MIAKKSHPAVFAGLMGCAVWGVPKLAFAISPDEVVTAVNRSLVLQFAIGCAIGALIAGAIAFVSDHLYQGDDEEDEPEEDFWSSSSLNLVNKQAEAFDDDPTGDLGRYRTGQITIELPVLEVENVPVKQAGPRHFATASSTKKSTKASSRRAGKHYAGASQIDQLAAKLVMANEPTVSAGKHFAHATAKSTENKAQPTDAPKEEKALEIPLIVTTSVKPVDHHGRARLENLPVINENSIPVSEEHVPMISTLPSPVAVEDKKPDKQSEHESLGITGRIRMSVAKRTKNVRDVLTERLSESALDGVPQITRADGSHLEVTPTWFDQTFVPALASITGITAKLDDTAPKMGEPATQEISASVDEVAEEDSRSSYISSRVSEVNLGMFPERRTVDELEGKDVWEEALAAMGETIGQSAPVFQDVVGGPSTIDDPDGLEGPTGFIPFRVPAAHPEVVDTESYIDYLLRDEMSDNSSQALRRSSRSYLRVIEGGTNPMRIRRLASETGAIRVGGRHFAQQRYAQEA